MKDLLPTTTLGKWSLGLVIAAFVCFAVFVVEIALGFRGGDTWTWDWPTIPVLLAGAFVFSSMVTGIIGIVKSKECSVLVILATAIGLFYSLLVLGQFVHPD
jgi:hypothetical protein